MKLAIMQPYFLPYQGYFQLINAADVFVLYDNIKYTKKGWINRNRMLLNNAAKTFSIPIKKASDHLTIGEREIADDFNRQKLMNKIRGAYSKAPYWTDVNSLLSQIILNQETHLFQYIYESITGISEFLGLDTKFFPSSTINIDHTLKAEEKVLALCGALGAREYINPIGGVALYDRATFAQRGVDLQFLQPDLQPYQQFGDAFVPGLSIIDLMSFNRPAALRSLISDAFDILHADDAALSGKTGL